ncbi:MAG: extracellular solute-binding protein family 1 [Chloroflexi bacterium]|nr:extracellular solute-binding protein family 1 [Chloroflexota bacterium]
MGVKTTSRHEFLKTAVGTIGAGVLAGAGLETGMKTVAAAPTATRVAALEPHGVLWGLNYEPHVQAYHRLAALFKMQTGSTLTVQPQAWPVDTKIIASIAAGTQPDVCCTAATTNVALGIQKALVPLDDSVFKYNHLNLKQDFVGDAIPSFTFQGKIYGVPVECGGITGNLVNVPVNALKKAGLANKYPPTNGGFIFNSHDDLFALAKALQVTKNGKVTRWGLCAEGWDEDTFWGMMLSAGTPPFDPQTKKFNFDSPAGIQVMQLHVETPVKMGIETEWNNIAACIDEALNGNAAVTLGNPTPSFTINKAHGYTFEMAGRPKINGRDVVFAGAGGWGFTTPIRAKHPNLALAFLRMIATREGQFQYSLIYGGNSIVAWNDLLLHDTKRFAPANNTNPNYKNRARWAQIFPRVKFVGEGEPGYYPKIGTAIRAACQGVREGKLNSQQAVKQIQKQAEAQYRQYQIDLANA